MKLEFPAEKLQKIKARYADAIEETVVENTDVPIFFIKKSALLDFLRSIRQEEGLEFSFLSDLTAYDDNPPLDKVADYGLGTLKNSGGDHRFVVVYQLLSMQSMDRIRIKVRVKENESTPSVTGVWKSADWLEREAFDMYGVVFSDHPNLKRILMDERWQGHPQRKDYPIKKYQRYEGSLPLEGLGLENS